MAAEVHGFQTEVSKLLTLLAKSLYSNKEVFLREIISNASDAIDKLRFLSITDPSLLGDDAAFCIRVKVDKDAKTLTVTDNGIGMTLEEANLHLGTIAKSGTADFLSNLSGDQAKDSQLIGQFGVGFYSAFIVADKVTVESRSAKAAAMKPFAGKARVKALTRARPSRVKPVVRASRCTSSPIAKNSSKPGRCAPPSRSIPTTSPCR